MSIKSALRKTIQGVSSVGPIHVPLRALSRKGLLPKTVWKHLPPDPITQVTFPNGNTTRYENVTGDPIGWILEWAGALGYENETSALFYEHARDARVVLDIGSFTGYFTLMAAAANPNAKLFAFEPVPRIYERLSRQVELNGLQDRATILNVAVSSESGTARFHVPNTLFPTSGSLNPDGFRDYEGQLIEVPMVTVDSQVPEDLHVDLLKLDVEGFEDKAMEGMKRIIDQCKPTMFVECLPEGPYKALDDFLTPRGYAFYHLLPDGPKKMERVIPDPQDVYRNYMFKPAD